MTIILQNPIRPGDVHRFRFNAVAFEHKSSVDYFLDDSLLIHIKALSESGCIVVNDRIAGQWRQEVQLPLAGVNPAGSVEVGLAFEPLRVRIQIGDAPPVVFERGTPLLEAAEIQVPDGVEVLQLDGQADAGSIRDPMGNSGLDPSIPAGTDAKIDVVDLVHLRCRLQPSGLPAGAKLLAMVDGRVCGALAVPAPPVSSDRKSLELTLDFPASALVADGMLAELVLESAGRRWSLASAVVASSLAGGIDRATDTMVRGWAANLHRPDRPMVVDIYVNGRFQGSARCDREREDLRQLDPALARSGFLFRFPEPVFLPESSDTSVSVRIHNTATELQNSPWWICRKVQIAALEASAAIA